MRITLPALLAAAMLLAGCAAKPLQAGAARIFVTHTPPPDECRFVGEVRGAQGNFWTAEFTSDEELIAGARNELRNRAAALGANYVTIETERYSNNTASDSLGGTYAAVIVGNAWYCDDGSAPVAL